MTPEDSRRALLRMLSTQLLPQARGDEPAPLLLMEPVRLHQQNASVTLRRGRPLADKKKLRSTLFLNRWPAQGMHAVRFPCLAAVIEGEVDWRIGITQFLLETAASSAPEKGGQSALSRGQYLVVPLRAGTFFLVPPGVPYSNGSSIHWERPAPRVGQATVFWLLLLPTGIMCHFCSSSDSAHRAHPHFFLPGSQAHHIAPLLEAELRQPQPESETLARLYLQAILHCARRGLQKQVPLYPWPSTANAQKVLHDEIGSHDALQRAQMFIESHLGETLHPQRIAGEAYLSARQLERHFQRELKTSIMDYVGQRRLETAKNLLQVSDLPIRQVAEIVGYSNPSSFTQIFKRRTGLSPLQYRRSDGAKT